MTLKKSFKVGYAKRKLEIDIKKLYELQKNFFVLARSGLTFDEIGPSLTQRLGFRTKELDEEKISETNIDDLEKIILEINSELVDYAIHFANLMYNEYMKKNK